MFGINGFEFVVLAILALIVVGPEKLPRYAADAARMLRRMRQLADDARSDVRRELGPEFENITLTDLNPRTMVRKHLLDPIDIDSLDMDSLDGDSDEDAGDSGPLDRSGRRPPRRLPGARDGSADKPAARRGPGRPPGPRSAEPPPYDTDAT